MQKGIIAGLRRQLVDLTARREKDCVDGLKSVAKLEKDLEWKKSLLVKRDKQIAELKELKEVTA